MKFASRIARLERRLAGGCAACLGRLVTRVWDEETEKRPAPVLCEVCGRDVTLYIRVVNDDAPFGRAQNSRGPDERAVVGLAREPQSARRQRAGPAASTSKTPRQISQPGKLRRWPAKRTRN